jgi:hypothetical protein
MKWLRGLMGVVATSLIIIRQTEAQRPPRRCWKGVERERTNQRAAEAREAIFTLVHIPSRGRSCVSALPLPRGGSLDPAHLSIDKEMAHKVLYSSHAAATAALIQPPLSLSRNLTPCIKSPNTQNPPIHPETNAARIRLRFRFATTHRSPPAHIRTHAPCRSPTYAAVNCLILKPIFVRNCEFMKP